MTRMTYRMAAITMALSIATTAQADEYRAALETYLNEQIRSWSSDQVLIDAVTAQNATTGAYTQDDIDALDTAWRNEVGASDRPTITPVLENAASTFLRDVVAAAEGVVTEVFIMDARGLNVAASDVTSDYWQGDEAKFTETYPAGPNAVHIGEVEFDESTQTYQGQVSIPIVDPATNRPIGAMTVGVNAEALL